MNEEFLLSQLSATDFVELPGFDHERDLLVTSLKARGYVAENIVGGIKITPAGLAYLAALQQKREDDLHKKAEKRAEKENHGRKLRSERCHDWLVAVIGALVAGLIVAAIGHFAGWT